MSGPKPSFPGLLHPIELAAWPRRDHWAHYRGQAPNSWELTVELDVSAFVAALPAAGRKTYPSQIWAVSHVVNAHEEFRMGLGAGGGPAIWDVVHPTFTVFHTDTETFSILVVPHEDDFARFHASVLDTTAAYRTDTRMLPQPELPANVFDVSTLPATSFTGFALHLDDAADHLAPIVTLGRYRRDGDRVLMPLALHVNHAAVDGFHASRLLTELQALFDEPSWLR